MASLDSVNNFKINYKNVEDYHNFIAYKNRLLNSYTINSDGVYVYSDELLEKIEEVRVNDYILNVDAFYINPLFLHYSSDERKGFIVNGQLLYDEQIKLTERYIFDFKVDVFPGTKHCVKRKDIGNEFMLGNTTHEEIKTIIPGTTKISKELKKSVIKKNQRRLKCIII